LLGESGQEGGEGAGLKRGSQRIVLTIPKGMPMALPAKGW